MRPRIALAKFLGKLGRFISSLPLMVMRPDDLVEYGRLTYGEDKLIQFYGSDNVINLGLSPSEKLLLGKTGLTRGKVLVLGIGGGREAIPLAKMGFAVTGVDFIPALVAMAKKNANKHGVHFDAQVGDFLSMALPLADFDLVMNTFQMYSSIPTRRSRIGFLKKVNEILKPGGWFICGFRWNPKVFYSPSMERLRKLFAHLTLGNLWYEPGDTLDVHFFHAFRDEGELASEFAEGGFALMHLHIPSNNDDPNGLALLHKTI